MELAVDCAYSTVDDKMLRDQNTEKAYATAVHEKLLLEQPTSLDAAVTASCQILQALHDANLLRDAALVFVVSSKTSHYRSTKKDRPKTKPSKGPFTYRT